jgi:hypothetical protein
LTQQAQKEVTHAAGLNRLDALVQPVVQQVGQNTPPGSPAEGQCWITGASPSGAWAGRRTAWRSASAERVYSARPSSGWWCLTPPPWRSGAGPPSLAAGEGVATSVTVPGAALGDLARASFSFDLQGSTLSARMSAADTVSVQFQNGSANAADLGSGTLRRTMEKA